MTKTACRVGMGGVMLLAAAVVTMFPVTVWGQIEEVVVTTRKKVENIQDVPIAVTAITAQEIERRGISDLAGVVKMSTSVQFDQAFGPQDTRIAVRGLSNTRGRSNVAFLVDGVDITTENFVSAGSGLLANQRLLNDVERIEIVKGPQSALYGRAAFAGAISYTTKEPGDEFESQLRLDAGDYGKFQLDGAVGGPVAGLEDVLGVRWTGAVWNHDGYYANRTTGQQMGDESGWGTALTAVLTPDANQDIKIKLRTEYSDSKIGQRPNVRVGGGTVGRGSGIGSDGMSFFPYPIDPGIIQGTSATSTRLADFGEYCPDTFPDQGSPYGGFCAPRGYGGASGLQPAVDVDPSTGADYKGTESELFRTTLNASINYDFGTVTSITGWTDFNATDELDQDYQASPVGMFDWKAHQQGRSQLDTRQFSEELRFASSFDGPVNFTVGGLYWNEDRRQEDLNYIISCLESGKFGGKVWPDPAAAIAGVCDGTNGTIDNWQQRALDQFPCQYDSQGNPRPDPAGVGNCLQAPRTPTPWRAETNHWSAYFNLTWDITDNFELILENRYVSETFELLRPNFTSCTSLFFGFGTNPTAPGVREGQVNTAADDIVCMNEKRLNPNIPSGGNDLNLGDWMLLEGSVDSSFNTPKVTLNWRPTDSSTYYFSWGKGIKPGGINTLAAGGSPTTIENERFKPEIVQAWEVGAKTDWELAGFLRLNGALFLNDYTDKQVGTQLVDDAGILQPRVVNAASAKVWGVELEATWQPEMIDGLVLSASYTYLDAKYDQFEDYVRSMIRAAYNGACPVVYRAGSEIVSPSAPNAEPFCALNMSGKQLERTPENAFTGNVQYTAPFLSTGFDWFVEGTATYQDERYIDFDNSAWFDEYWLLDTRLGLQGEQFEFLIYVDNLLDDDTLQTGGTGPDFGKQVTELGFTAGLGATQFFAVMPNPRQMGIRVTMRF